MRGRLLIDVLAGTIVSCLCFWTLYSGGPDFVRAGGEVLKWQEPVALMLDQGPLGNLTNTQAIQLVLNAVQSWEEVETSTISFSIEGSLNEDINFNNYKMFLGGQNPGVNPVIFDHDGKIIDDFLGTNSSSSVLGFAGVRILDPENLAFRSGWAVLNGKRASQGTFPQVVTHELGHMIGLDHSQGLITNTAGCSRFPPSGQFCDFIPMMYPLIFQAGPTRPIRDDIAWISWLYPTPEFSQQTGTIKGQIFRRTGSPLFNANVVAVKVEDSANGPAQSNEEYVSVVSDFLLTEDGSYEIPGLVPGKYVVFVEPVHSSFVDGSGVGPRNFRYSNFDKEFWDENESGDASQDHPNLKAVIEVKAGETVSGINIIINEDTNLPHILTDDGEMLYIFPDGFTFPFYGKTYSEVVINSDGNLTFTRGDSVSTPRTEQRFLSGPPRIAPFFTDLNPGFGTIRVVENAASLEFIWDDVAEYDQPLNTPRNTFSVTLYSNGDIRFHYQQITATPDPDGKYSQGLLGIVGITPGGGAEGNPQNLLAGGGVHEIGQDPIYQVFPGTSFNLVGEEVFFQASAHEIYFPFYTGNQEMFTGFAVSNFGADEAEVFVENRQLDGELASYLSNPAVLDIPSGDQLAQLGAEIFGIDFSTEQSGWVRMRSSRPELASFFQFGNGLSSELTKMDGGISQTQTSSRLVFTRVHQGTSSFRLRSGFLQAATFLNIANPGLEQIGLDLRLYSNSGAQLARVQRAVDPLGVLRASVAELFDVPEINDGFVEVDVEGGEAVGFQVIELADTLLGLNAVFPHDKTVSYSAQLGHGPDIFTSLKLVNPTDFLINVTLTAFLQEPQGGVSERVVGPIVLGPNQTFQRTVDEIFGLAGEQVGSIRVESSQGGILGDVVFGEPLSAQFAAAMSLQTTPFTQAVFSQVANGTIDPQKPSLNSFTGIALFNPNNITAQVQIEVFDRDGELAGETVVQLAPGQRLSEVLEDMIPSTEGLIRGYIIVESNQPIVAQQLLGNKTLRYLSAVPPTIIEAP